MSSSKIYSTISLLLLCLMGHAQNYYTTDIHDSLGNPWKRMGKYYRDGNFVDTAKIFPEQIMFELYSISKLWNEDTCGHKGYRQSVVEYIKSMTHHNTSVLSTKDIINLLGGPDHIEPGKRHITYRYPLVKEADCKTVSQYAWLDFLDNALLQVEIENPMFRVDH